MAPINSSSCDIYEIGVSDDDIVCLDKNFKLSKCCDILTIFDGIYVMILWSTQESGLIFVKTLYGYKINLKKSN